MVCVVFPFSRKKIKIDELVLVRKTINDYLQNYVNHLRGLERAIEIVMYQNEEILKLLGEKEV